MIAVIQGGHESEAEVSRMTSRAFQEALDELGYKYKVIEYDEGFRHNLETLKPKACLLALHGTYSEDGVVQDLLERMKIPYTGSGVEASRLSFSKERSLKKAAEMGIPVLPSFSCTNEDEVSDEMHKEIASWSDGFVVKPSESGSSRGVSLCDDMSELKAALEESFKWHGVAIIEKRVKGREITAAVFQEEAFELIEIRPKTGFYDMKNKYTKGATDYLVPAPVSEGLKKDCQKYAVQIYKEFKLRTYGRVDFLITNDESECYFMEVNTLPGCTQTSLFPKALAQKGIEFKHLVDTLIKTAALES
ncbi:MAG: D-alanine--D-alanine ligase family protein [Bdellovibrionales bacterium]